MRILTTMICAVAVIALFGCGGSSYLSESPTDGNVSSLAFEVDGIVSPQEGSVLTKDIVLSHVTGDANNNSGNTYLDAGMHSCWFDVESSDPAVVGVDTPFETCADPLNCAVCTIVDGDVDADPNCSISCVVNVIPRPALAGMSLTIYYGDDVYFWTDSVGSSGGALRIDGIAAPSGSHLFDPTSVMFIENNPASLDGIKITDGVGVEDLFTADVLGADGFTRIYNISNTELDPSASSFDSHIPDNMAWVRIGVMLTGSIDLSNLEVPGTSESYPGGYMSTNAGMWHDSANQASTF